MNTSKLLLAAVKSPVYAPAKQREEEEDFVLEHKVVIKKTPKPIPVSKPIIKRKEYKEVHQVPFKKLEFVDGGVKTELFLKALNQDKEVFVENHALKSEFNSIKEYFSKLLKIKKISIEVSLVVRGRELEECSAQSKEIEGIDGDFLSNLTFHFIKHSARKGLENDTKKSRLFSPDDFLVDLGQQHLVQQAYASKNFLEDLLMQGKHKHHRQLRYLSTKYLTQIKALKFTIHPFSFIFGIELDDAVHFIWESVDTEEATYIWKFQGKGLIIKELLEEIELTINDIKSEGKQGYLSNAPAHFTRVMHDYRGGKEGFEVWRKSLVATLGAVE